MFESRPTMFDDKQYTGRVGELLSARDLKLLSLVLSDGKVIRNVYVPTSNGHTTEIDVLYVTSRGIFVIESKNFSGWIFGNEADRYWTQSLKGGEKNRFYNPVLQNRGHIKWLREYLGEDIPMYSVIVFSERCELKKVTVSSRGVAVVKRDDLIKAVKRFWNASSARYSEAHVNKLYQRLQPLTNVSYATKREHVADVKLSRSRPAKTSSTMRTASTKPSSKALICPQCGDTLVVRTAKKGPNAGKRFYGCSNYPSCHYTRNL